MTKLIFGERGTGKTTKLVQESSATGYRIVTCNRGMVQVIKETAEKLNLKIPEPLTVDEYRNKHLSDCKPNEILVDNGEEILSDALYNYFGVPVSAVTLSNEVAEDGVKG